MTTEPVGELHEQRFRQGAEAGDPAAMAGLGWALLQQGRDADAERWYARAANAGELSGMTGLGYMLNRRGAKEEAQVWWRRAAEGGDATAMDSLASSFGRWNPEGERWGWHAVAARRDLRTEEVPPEVTSAATAAGLGAHRSTFGPDRAPSGVARLVPCLILAAFPAGIGLWLYALGADSPNGPPTGWIIGCLVAAVAVALLTAASQRPAKGGVMPRAWVFEHGFVFRQPSGQLDVLPWTEIRVLRDITRHYRNGVYTHSTLRYGIKRQDGTALVLTDWTLAAGDLCVLGETIEREISRVRLPWALAALQEGRQLDFGDVSVDLRGITAGQDRLPWSEVQTIDVADGKVRIKRAGGWLSWSKTPVSAIPDVIVLLTLTDALHRAARATD